MLKLIYVFFLGLLLAVFVGVGISVFYSAPTEPEFPPSLEYVEGPTSRTLTSEQKADQATYDKQLDDHSEQFSVYNRNVSIVATVFAILFLATGVGLAHKIDVIADGVLLGGVFTLVYSMGRGISSHDETFRFLIITVGLAIAIALGYLKFVKPQSSPTTK